MEAKIPCHFCASENALNADYCINCKALIRIHLKPTNATQFLSLETDRSEQQLEELIRETYLVAALLLQSAYRLKVLMDATGLKRTA
jgi:hypothetical protein